MVILQLEMSRHVTGFVHVQTNPYYSYDTDKTVKNARRMDPNTFPYLWKSH